MKLLCSANLMLGRNALPPIFTRKLCDTAIQRKLDGLILMNLCAPTGNPWQLVSSRDWRDNLGEYSPVQRGAGVIDISLVLGPDDIWLDAKPYRKVKDGLEAKGITLLRGPTDEVGKVVFASGMDGIFAPPADPPGWIARALRVAWPTFNPIQQRGCRREEIAGYAAWAQKRGFPVTVHGLTGAPTWGRRGESWVGGPGMPPYALLIDADWPSSTEIVRF